MFCLFALFASLETANACSCVPIGAGELLHKADIVFRGTITDIRDIDTATGGGKRVAIFRVSRVWKGAISEIVSMPAIENAGGMCLGFPKGLLAIGNELLVYAYRERASGDYVTDICSHTWFAKQTNDVHELGRGKRPKRVRSVQSPNHAPA